MSQGPMAPFGRHRRDHPDPWAISLADLERVVPRPRTTAVVGSSELSTRAEEAFSTA
jgi:hypothetical protein